MRKWYQLIGLSVLLVMIGIVLIAVGVNKGGETSVYFGDLFKSQERRQEQTKGVEIDELIQSVNDLDINVEVGVIKVVKGSDYRVYIPASYNNKISYEIKNNKLIIRQKGDKKVVLGFFGIQLPNKTIKGPADDIIIYIPENAEIKNINLKCGVGEVEIKQVKADRISVSIGVGALEMDDIAAKRCEIEGGVGEVQVKRLIAHTLDVEAGVGEIDIEGEFKGDVTLNGGVGEITLRAKGAQSDFNYKLEKGLGEIKLNNKAIGNMKSSSNDANKTIKVSSGIGSIAIYIGE